MGVLHSGSTQWMDSMEEGSMMKDTQRRKKKKIIDLAS